MQFIRILSAALLTLVLAALLLLVVPQQADRYQVIGSPAVTALDDVPWKAPHRLYVGTPAPKNPSASKPVAHKPSVVLKSHHRAHHRAHHKQVSVTRHPTQRHTSRSHARALSSGSPKAYAASRVASGQFSCLERLWQRESGWQASAHNPSSGAHGIPQALPGSKMASAGPNWRTNYRTQIDWGLGYIRNRYGSACNALAHSNSNGWY